MSVSRYVGEGAAVQFTLGYLQIKVFMLHVYSMQPVNYSDNSIKNTVLRPNRQYKASTAKMAEIRYS